MSMLENAIAWTMVMLVLLLAVTLMLWIWLGKVNLAWVISEKITPDGKPRASSSRLQLLIFSFTVALLFLWLTLRNGAFPDLSAEIVALLGISGGSYVVSKGIQSRDNLKLIEKMEARTEPEAGDS